MHTLNLSDNIQTNTFAAAELEWVTISVICHFRPNLTEVLLRRGLLSIVYSIRRRYRLRLLLNSLYDRQILDDNAEPYGGLPPKVGQEWLNKHIA